MEVYNQLGYGFLEIVYKDAMELEFLNRGIPFHRESRYQVIYKGQLLKHHFVTDFTLFDRIIVEVKSAREGINPAMQAQLLNYLKSSTLRLGLIINFGKTSLEHQRFVL